MENLFDGFGSHRVNETETRPVQDDGVHSTEGFKEDGLLQVWLTVSVFELAVALLLPHMIMGQNFMGNSLLLILEPTKETDS